MGKVRDRDQRTFEAEVRRQKPNLGSAGRTSVGNTAELVGASISHRHRRVGQAAEGTRGGRQVPPDNKDKAISIFSRHGLNPLDFCIHLGRRGNGLNS